MFVTSSPVDVECTVVDGHVGVESTSDATSSREEGDGGESATFFMDEGDEGVCAGDLGCVEAAPPSRG